MFDEYTRKRALLKEKREIDDLFAPRFLKASNNYEIERLHHEKDEVIYRIEESLSDIEDKLLIDKARSLYIDLPSLADKNIWELHRDSEIIHHLTVNGKFYLNREIRKEKKERQEMGLSWLKTLVPIIGALTGLAAVLLSG